MSAEATLSSALARLESRWGSAAPDIEMPEGVQFNENEGQQGAITLWFIRNGASYQQSIVKRRGLAKKSKLWIVWPKGEAGKRAGITQNLVRETALAVGLVDYKICAIDDVWSAIVFAPGKGT